MKTDEVAMHWIDYVLSQIPLAVLLVGGWLGKNLIITRLTNGVAAEFQKDIEELKSTLRRRESEIEALRNGALTAMVSRQQALDSRRIDAAESIWSAVITLAPQRALTEITGRFKMPELAKEAETNRELHASLSSFLDSLSSTEKLKAFDWSNTNRARLFVSEITWALFEAYRSVVLGGAFKAEMFKVGLGQDSEKFQDWSKIEEILKLALPDYSGYIGESYRQFGYLQFVSILEERLFQALRDTLSGKTSDSETISQARAIQEAVSGTPD